MEQNFRISFFQESERNIEMARTVQIHRFLAVLACSLVLMGCEDEEKKKALEEAEEAKMTLARVKVSLTKANRQMADLKEVLEVVTESRDELQKQIEQLLQERGHTVAEVEKAQEGINDRTSQLNQQTQSVVTLQNQIKKLNAVIEEQETIIAEQQIIIEQLQNIPQQQNETVEEQPENEEEPQETPEPG